jgi:hypothetical protein
MPAAVKDRYQQLRNTDTNRCQKQMTAVAKDSCQALPKADANRY